MLTNFPNGISSNGLSVLSGGTPTTFGKYIFVDSNGNGGDGLGAETPLATIDEGINIAVTGDIIVVSEGHTETVSAASGYDADVAGISIIGLGTGDNRPTITFDTATTADVDYGASNVLTSNIIFINDIDALAEPIDIEASVDNVEFINCEFRDDTAAKQTVRWAQTAATNTGIKFIGCKNVGSDTAGATSFITFIGGSKNVVKDCVSNGDFSAANIEIKTTLTGDLVFQGNLLENANAVDVNIEGNSLSNTGFIANNYCRIATDGQLTFINATGDTQLFENYGVNNSAERGVAIGTVSS